LWQLLLDAESDDNDDKSYIREPNADGIATLRLRDFDFTPERMGMLFSSVEKSKGMIIDLRGNPGGSVDALASLASEFVSEPETMAEVITRKKTEPVKLKPKRSPYRGPVAILVDQESASAAEMFAKYMQLKKRATVIGDKTSGHVTASQFWSEQIGTDSLLLFGVQIGVGRIVFPDKEELEKKGVTPDTGCIPTAADLREGKDPCYGQAIQYVKSAIGEKKVAQAN
jgi:carboxyl-terminal processing protease